MSTEEHKQLVAKIYSVHEKLRTERRKFKDGDKEEAWDKVWKEHTKDIQTLKEYSAAMAQLATKVWEPKHSNLLDGNKLKCRLDWVHEKCRDYFFTIPSADDKNKKKLKLLDVGSCYNPFRQKFGDDIYDITAIDLCPAPGQEDNVHTCDFLALSIIEEKEFSPPPRFPSTTTNLVSHPPNYFDIVVFSFFLEYLPDAGQRLESCRKAHQLLKPGGLLFILRPDSGSVTPTGVNSRLMKALKVGAGFLGFKRIYFEKLEHLWAMAFQKLSPLEGEELVRSGRFLKDVAKVEENFQFSSTREKNGLEILFSISQDFKKEVHNNIAEKVIIMADIESFQELPYCTSNDDDDQEQDQYSKLLIIMD